jgi:hypothetical protein
VYEGEYKNGRRNGRGNYSYARKGGRYNGEWSDNKKNGIGTMEYPDQSKYTGMDTTRHAIT